MLALLCCCIALPIWPYPEALEASMEADWDGIPARLL